MLEIFKSNLSVLRSKKGVSVYKMANEIGLHKNTMRNICYGNNEPKASQLLLICDYFEVSDVRSILTTKMN